MAATFAFNEVATSASKDEEAVRADVSTVFKKPGLLASFSDTYRRLAKNSTDAAFSVQSVEIQNAQKTVSQRAVTLYKTDAPVTLSTEEESKGGLSAGIIVAIVLAILILSVLIAVAVFCLLLKPKEKEAAERTEEMQTTQKPQPQQDDNPLSPQRRYSSPRADHPAPVLASQV